jgi:hypothetical protein
MPALDGSGASLLQGAYAQVELGANGAPIGAVSVEADGVDPRPGDDAGSPLRDLVVHGAGLGTPGRTTPGDVIPTPGSSGAVGPGITTLPLPSPPLFIPGD